MSRGKLFFTWGVDEFFRRHHLSQATCEWVKTKTRPWHKCEVNEGLI
jgi:hypothetical protein